MKKKTITIVDNRNGNHYEFNIKDGSYGPPVVDLDSFYNKTGLFAYKDWYDPNEGHCRVNFKNNSKDSA